MGGVASVTHKNNNNKMEQTIWIKHQRSDRNMVLITNGGMLEGVNYWQGLGSDELFTDYNRIDDRLTTYVLPRMFSQFDTHRILPYPEYEEMVEFIDDAIWEYVERDNKTIGLKSIGQWMYGTRLYTMHKSDNGLILPCTYSQDDETRLDELTKWSFDNLNTYDIDCLYSNGYAQNVSHINALIAKDTQPTTIAIPNSQTDLIRKALIQYLSDMKRLVKCPTEAQAHEMFDIHELESLMKYEVSVTLTADQARTFTGDNGIDLPMYIYK